MTWFFRVCRVWWCFLPLVVLSHPAYADPAIEVASADQMDTVETREVVVSATKTPVPVTQLTSAVEVIKGEDLEKKKIKTVIDALRLAQGVVVFSNGGPGTTANARIRGGKAEHTLVVIDGTIVNDPATGAFDFANLTTDNIESIEILRGAQSMLWGADAIGGVINITTKRGAGRPTANAFVEYGSFATIREGGSVSGKQGIVDYSFSLSRWDTSSFSAINYRRGATERDGYHNWQGSSRIGIALPHDGRLDFNLRWLNADNSFDGLAGDAASSPADIFGSRATARNLILSGSYEQPLTSWWSQKLTLAQGKSRSLQHSGSVGRNLVTGETMSPDQNCFTSNCFFPFTFDLEVVNRRVEWQHNFQIGKPLLLTAGYQFREDQGNNPNNFGAPGNRILSSHAGFAQAQVNIQERLFMTAGVRHDSYNAFGEATTYRVTGGYLFQETGTKIRGSYATGFRAPTMNQLFFQDPSFPTPIPNLKPEKSKSMDVGIDQSFLEGMLKFNVGYFWNHYDNLIQFFSSPPIVGLQNIGQANSKGYELGFSFQVLKELELHGQYTATLTHNLSPQANGARLPLTPVDAASAGATYQPIDSLRVTVDYRYVGSRVNSFPVAGMRHFNVVNASASYDVTRNWQIFGRVDNLLNEKYEEILNFGTPIRSVFGGVKFTY
jgi:vitamin B12 transporter